MAIHTQNIERSSDSVSPIHRYCSYVVRGHCDLPRLLARARFLVSLCRTRRRSALPRRLRSRAKNVLLFVTFSSMIPPFPVPVLPLNLVSRRGFSRPTPPRPAHLLFAGCIALLRERKMGGATRGVTAEPTSRDQNKRQERGQGKEHNKRRSHKKIRNFGAETEAARQSGAVPRATERNKEPSTCA